MGVKLLALSLQRHCPATTLLVYTEQVPDGLRPWMQTHCPAVELRQFTPTESNWDVKPAILMQALAEHETAVWLDADVIVAGNLEPLLDGLPVAAFTVAEDPWPEVRTIEQCAFFQRTPRRNLPRTVNSGFVGVHRCDAHVAVLREWQHLLSDSQYLDFQLRPAHERPGFMIGDQDVLAAVLASIDVREANNFGPNYLRSGETHLSPIVPEALTIRQRLSLVFDRKRPAIVHIQGLAPWRAQHWPTGLLTSARWQLHPYTEIARSYRRWFTAEELQWTGKQSWFSRGCRWLTCCHPYLQGVPLVVAGQFYRWWLNRRSAGTNRGRQSTVRFAPHPRSS